MYDVLLGVHRHTIDSKNRVFIPVKHRSFFEGGIFLMKVPGQPAVQIARAEHAKMMEQKINAMEDPVKRNVLHDQLFMNAGYIDLDAQGRILVDPKLLSYIGVKAGDPVVISAHGDYDRLWAEDEFDKRYDMTVESDDFINAFNEMF